MESASRNPNTLRFSCVNCGFTYGVTESETLVQSTSILASLSTSNNLPSAAEWSVLAGESKAISQAILFLDSQIASLQSVMEALERKRQQLKSNLGVYKQFAFNPCRRLPNELLEIIFARCVDADVNVRELLESPPCTNDFPSTLDTKKSPWVLSQVCHRWRDVVLSLPHLWETVDINWKVPPSHEKSIDYFVFRRLMIALHRSGDRPLNISWNQRSSKPKTFFLALCTKIPHWKSATIRTGFTGLRRLIPFSGAFSMLSDLHLDFTSKEDWMRLDQDDPILSVFRNAPALRHVTLSGDHSATRRLDRQIPWSQITRFSVKNRGRNFWRHCEAFLPWLTNVEELTFEQFGFIYRGGTRVRLERVHTLDVHGVCSSVYGLLISIAFPSLRKLTIFPAYGATPFILQFLAHSACRLRYLSISDTGDDLIDLLKGTQLQTVHTISLTGKFGKGNSLWEPEDLTVSDAVLDALKFLPSTETGTNVLPHLTDLTLAGRVKNWSDKALVEMLASRRDIDQFPPRNDVEDADAAIQLTELVEGGLVINQGM
ncbi:hypothetical protein L218DRAFT_951250 [Marasmius fiardii PR-910]|nr:hypothetical protein L218DRAFT_951250 [Marasmius fiardii PR-910]